MIFLIKVYLLGVLAASLFQSTMVTYYTAKDSKGVLWFTFIIDVFFISPWKKPKYAALNILSWYSVYRTLIVMLGEISDNKKRGDDGI